MQKKIVAVSLVILMVALLLASCGNKYLMGEINGVERPLVTDAEGNTEIDDEGKIAVYVTDAKGNIQYDEEGNPQKNYYDLPEKTVNGNTLETVAYKFTMPEGWTLKDDGVFYKKGTDDKCYVKCLKDATLKEGETYEGYLTQQYNMQNEFIEKIKKQYPDSSINTFQKQLLSGESVTLFEFSVQDDSGAILFYGVSAYINIKNDVYSVNYTCDGGVGYDESFDFIGLVCSNLVIKK